MVGFCAGEDWKMWRDEGFVGGKARGGGKLREGAWIGAIYAQFGRDLHRNKSVETGNSRAILICNGREIFQRRERNESQPEDRQRNSIRATENGRRTESLHDMKDRKAKGSAGSACRP